MKGIQVKNGALFVTDGTYTVRLLPDGECGPSPVMYEVLAWDLRTEPPKTWEYLTLSDLQGLPDGGYAKIEAAFAKMHEQLRAPSKNEK